MACCSSLSCSGTTFTSRQASGWRSGGGGDPSEGSKPGDVESSTVRNIRPPTEEQGGAAEIGTTRQEKGKKRQRRPSYGESPPSPPPADVSLASAGRHILQRTGATVRRRRPAPKSGRRATGFHCAAAGEIERES